MTGIWLLSYLLLWILVVLISLVSIALGRQIGILHTRIPATAAHPTSEGPTIGTTLKATTQQTIMGEEILIGAPGKCTLLVFLAPSCSTCSELAPALRTIVNSERNQIDCLIISSEQSRETNLAFISTNHLGGIPMIASPELSDEFSIFHPPYAFITDEDSVVRAKGTVNRLEHLESLLAVAYDAGRKHVETGTSNVAIAESID